MKSSPDFPPRVSVVTVVRNDAKGLEATMDSVAAQDYPSVEYLVVDGASTDGTIDVVRRRAAEIDAWRSEPDGGIYDAMNKGCRMASGEYVGFMNAGDRYASADVLTRMFNPVPSAELLWGDCLIETSNGEEYDCAREVLRTLYRQMTVSHQSLFVKRAALVSRPFDTSLRIAADYDFLCERLLAGASWEYRALPVSRINDRGISARNYTQSIREKRRVSLARFKEKRVAIRAYYAILSVYMSVKMLLRRA
jgi:putative colanic acid biosynthesis glycosyltransferase